jgi:hypothetical protein
MKNLFYFILGVCLITLTSATTVSIMTVKPVTPKSTVVKPIRAMFGIENEIADYVTSMVKKGYIVKSIAIIDDENWSKGVIVMEKYN